MLGLDGFNLYDTQMIVVFIKNFTDLIKILGGGGSPCCNFDYRVSHKKVSIITFCRSCSRRQLTAFEFICIQYICKFCLVYHLKHLDASR